MNIDVHIERLVLDGFAMSPRDANLVRVAVEGELARLLCADRRTAGVAVGGAVPEIPAPPAAWAPGAQPQEIGRRVAESLHGGLRR